jgi:hypothetical protein
MTLACCLLAGATHDAEVVVGTEAAVAVAVAVAVAAEAAGVVVVVIAAEVAAEVAVEVEVEVAVEGAIGVVVVVEFEVAADVDAGGLAVADQSFQEAVPLPTCCQVCSIHQAEVLVLYLRVVARWDDLEGTL